MLSFDFRGCYLGAILNYLLDIFLDQTHTVNSDINSGADWLLKNSQFISFCLSAINLRSGLFTIPSEQEFL